MPRKSKRAEPLYTLTEVAKRTGISMPTLQRYKKLYQDRIPSEGEGRKQRYPHSSLKVFKEIKKENIGRRGRPRKAADERKPARGRKPKASKRKPASTRAEKAGAKDKSDLLTLTEIGRRTGISYPTLTRYVKKYGDQLKSEGTGRSRRFYEEAVEVFQQLRSQSRRGGGRKAASAKSGGRKSAAGRKTTRRGASTRGTASDGDKPLNARITALEKKLAALEKKLSKPVRFTVLPS